jgi:hypothetical protein
LKYEEAIISVFGNNCQNRLPNDYQVTMGYYHRKGNELRMRITCMKRAEKKGMPRK